MMFLLTSALPPCLIVGNALQSIATPIMKGLRISHIYGQTAIHSLFCDQCQQRSFIVSGCFSCCGRSVSRGHADKIKIEVDSVGFKRKRPPKWLRDAVLEEQHNKCLYCGREFGMQCENGDFIHVKIHWDHVIPFSYNGNNYDFVAACPRCNIRKGARVFGSAAEVRAFLKEKYGSY